MGLKPPYLLATQRVCKPAQCSQMSTLVHMVALQAVWNLLPETCRIPIFRAFTRTNVPTPVTPQVHDEGEDAPSSFKRQRVSGDPSRRRHLMQVCAPFSTSHVIDV